MKPLIFTIAFILSLDTMAQNIRGVVSDNNGKPLSGVAVSDGIDIVKTDSKGQYAI